MSPGKVADARMSRCADTRGPPSRRVFLQACCLGCSAGAVGYFCVIQWSSSGAGGAPRAPGPAAHVEDLAQGRAQWLPPDGAVAGALWALADRHLSWGLTRLPTWLDSGALPS